MQTDIPIPNDYERLYPWFNVIRQLNTANIGKGNAILTITVMVAGGYPVLHTAPLRQELYPRAKKITIEMIDK